MIPDTTSHAASTPTDSPRPTPTGLKFTRTFSTPGTSPYDAIQWRKTTAEIKDESGKVVFTQEVEVPASWSDQAARVVASKYFYGDIAGGSDPAKGGREHSARQLVGRVAGTISDWGRADGYFASEADGDVFEDELTTLLLGQYGAFNSPVWFNVGLSRAYGIKGARNGYRWDPKTDKIVQTEDIFEFPQGSACFLQSITDDMGAIGDLLKSEMMLFKGGSGTGTDLSPLRSSKEKLSGGGSPSGPVSFMKVYDAAAGVIKSGGRTRRSAKMQLLRCDHPDIVEFVECKTKEEAKARALIAAGYDSSFNGEAYASIAFQNANLSVSATDEFMSKALLPDENARDRGFNLIAVTTGKPIETVDAKELLDTISKATHGSGDPGMFFVDTINRWHTSPADGPIVTCNPCQPGFATVLTPYGIRTFDDINVGSIIWGGKRWTRVARKVATGIKPVNRYETTAGSFVGTENHQIISEGRRVEARDARSIDRCVGPQPVLEEIDRQDVVDGWVFGDGSVHKASNDLVHLCLGRDDACFHDDYGDFVQRHRPGLHDYAWEVQTTMTAAELPKTFNRVVPDRFRMGSPDKVRGFLRGLYAANGSVCGGRVTLKAASFDVIQAVREMLSSMGIRSYATCNKPAVVSFANGDYECKESYDLNITVDRRAFADQIGFVHPHKSEKLGLALLTKPNGKSKTTYAIGSVVPLGEFPVYDITVEDEDHVYWTGGLLVSNCGEYVYVSDSACNLASINLMKFRKDDGSFDANRYMAACRVFLVAQEILVDRASYPTEKIAYNSHRLRPLGLGYCGLGALIMSGGFAYDSSQGRTLASLVTSIMTAKAYLTSTELAQAKGVFEGYPANRDRFLEVMGMHSDAAYGIDPFGGPQYFDKLDTIAAELWEDVINEGTEHGFRNGQVSLVAPTGTIAFLMDSGHSTGLEPGIALVQYKTLAGGGMLKIVNPDVERALRTLGYSEDKIVRILKHIEDHDTIETVELSGGPVGMYDHESGLKAEHLPIFDCAFPPANGSRSISWEGHVKMLSAIQPFISGSSSKTVNMPKDSTVEDISGAYLMAWRMGVKDVAIYRDGSKESQPVSTSKAKAEDSSPVIQPATDTPSPVVVYEPRRTRLPDTRRAVTHKLSVGSVEAYLTIGEFPDGRPGEVFVQIAKEGSTLGGLMDAWATMVSIGLQYGIPIDVIVRKFEGGRFEPAGMTRNPSEIPIASSLIDYVARWLGMRYVAGYREAFAPRVEGDEIADEAKGTSEVVQIGKAVPAGPLAHSPICPKCGSLSVPTGRCHTCPSCGESIGGCG